MRVRESVLTLAANVDPVAAALLRIALAHRQISTGMAFDRALHRQLAGRMSNRNGDRFWVNICPGILYASSGCFFCCGFEPVTAERPTGRFVIS
jgi:hypothetical protein